MSLALSQAAPLKPEIRLSQALGEFAAALDPNRKVEYRVLSSQQSPSFRSVIELANEVARDGKRQHGNGWLPKFGPRLEPLLHRIQLFSKAGDILIGGSQNMVASGVWACVRVFLQMTIGYLSFFDKLSQVWDRIGQSASVHAKLAEIFPTSPELQKYMCEYLIVIVGFCNKSLAFLNKSRLQQLAASFAMSFDQLFRDFEQQTARWAALIEGTVTTLMAELQISNKQALSTQYTVFSSFMNSSRGRHFEERRIRLLKKLSPSQDEYECIWRREQKKGSVEWIFNEDEYASWKDSGQSSVLVITGPLGSGKTVLLANVIKDLYLAEDSKRRPNVASFFCQYQNYKTLDAGVVLRSIAHQIIRGLGVEDTDLLSLISTDLDSHSGTDATAIFESLRRRLPTTYTYFIAIDALDECRPQDRLAVLSELRAMATEMPLHIVLSARNSSDVLDESSSLPKVHHISMANTKKDVEIAAFIDREISRRGRQLDLDQDTEAKIKLALVAAAQGMYLWVILQLDALFPPYGGLISREVIMGMLKNLPQGLTEAYNRAIAKINAKHYGSRMFKMVAGAIRPMTIYELRVALNITPGTALWNQDSMELNPRALVWHYGGGLLEVDESSDTVLWIHHSAMMHLLEDTDAKAREHSHESDTQATQISSFDLDSARLDLGLTCVTYLSLDVHDRRVQLKTPKLRTDMAVKTIKDSVSAESWMSKIALSLASRHQASGTSQVDINKILEDIGQTRQKDQSTILEFLPYAQEHWLAQTRNILVDSLPGDALVRCRSMFLHLLQAETHVATKPWTAYDGRAAVLWAIEHGHHGVFVHFVREVFPTVLNMPRDPNTISWLVEQVKQYPHSIGYANDQHVVGTILSWTILLSDSFGLIQPLYDLLELGANANYKFEWKNGRQYDMLQLALDLPLRDALESSPGRIATERFPIIMTLLDHGASLETTYKHLKDYPVFLAIKNGLADCAEAIISGGPLDCVRGLSKTSDWNTPSLLGLTIESFRYDQSRAITIMRSLVKKFGFDPDEPYYHQNHSHPATEATKCRVARWPRDLAELPKPPIMVTIAYELWDLTEILISCGAKVHKHWNGIAPIALALEMILSRRLTPVLPSLGRELNFGIHGNNMYSKTLARYEEPAEPLLFIALRAAYTNFKDSPTSNPREIHGCINQLASAHYSSRKHQKSPYGLSALGMVSEWGHIGFMELLLSKGADPNESYTFSRKDSKAQLKSMAVDMRDSEAQLPLMALFENEELPTAQLHEAVLLLIDSGASLNIQHHGVTIFGHIVRLGQMESVVLLFENYRSHFSVSKTNLAGQSALEAALERNDLLMATLIEGYQNSFFHNGEQHGPYFGFIASEDPKSDQTEGVKLAAQPLLAAIEQNDLSEVQKSLYDLEPRARLRGAVASLGLVRAIDKVTLVDPRIAECLLAYGANVRARFDPPLLIRAIASGKMDIVETMIRNYVPVNCVARTTYHTVCMGTTVEGMSPRRFGMIGRQYVKVSKGDTAYSVAGRMGITSLQRLLGFISNDAK